jgi:hypothetical protein
MGIKRSRPGIQWLDEERRPEETPRESSPTASDAPGPSAPVTADFVDVDLASASDTEYMLDYLEEVIEDIVGYLEEAGDGMDEEPPTFQESRSSIASERRDGARGKTLHIPEETYEESSASKEVQY